MNYQNLLATIDANVYENGAQLITGDIMQQVLHALVDSLGAGYQYMGEATPAGTPAYLDPRQFWLAVTAGTYTNFGGITVDGKSLVVITYDGTFTKTVLPIPTSDALTEALADYQPLLTFDDEPTEGSANPVKSDGIARALADKVDKSEEALLPGVVAGSADKVLNPVAAFAKYLFRRTGGGASVASGPAVLRSLRGTTLIWNQMVQASVVNVTSDTYNGLVLTNNGDGTITISGTSSASGSIIIASNLGLSIPTGRKILIKQPTGASSSFYLRSNTGGAYSWSQVSDICTLTEAMTGGSLSLIYGSGVQVNVTFGVNIHDITLLGLDTLTAAEFSALYPLPYYAYNPGTRINNKTVALESVGFNQWDEEWENGAYNNNGEKVVGATQIRCKNKIPVIPNTTYFINKDNFGNIFGYDADGDFISALSFSAAAGGYAFAVPADCHYITFYMYASYGATYKGDICINLSDPSRNGEYQPYRKETTHLGLDELQVKDAGGNITTVYGLDGVGTAFDEVDPVNKKYIKRMGEVDLGDLTWAYSSVSHRMYVTNGVPDAMDVASTVIPNLICTKYTADTYNNTLNNVNDKALNVSNGSIYIYDSASGADAATFKAAMAGVKMVYELATPEVFDLVDPMPDVYQAEAGGTEQAVQPDGGSTPNAPFYVGTQYSVEPAGSDLVVALAQGLQDAGIISAFALTYDDGKPQFTITA